MKKTLSLFVLALASFAAFAGASSPGPVVEEKPLVFSSLTAAVAVAGRMAVNTFEKFGGSPFQVTICERRHGLVVRASGSGSVAFATVTRADSNTYAVEHGALRGTDDGECRVLDSEALLNNLRGQS